MNRLRLLLALACAALLVLPATALGIINGTADGGAHPYVAFVGQLGAPRQACTGTLVAPTVVVTAAHCASTPGEPMAVILGENPRAVPLEQWYFGTFQPDPEFCAGCGKGLMGEVTHDLAVILLDRTAPGPYAKLPAQRAFEELRGPYWKQMTLVGYGVQSFTPEGIPVSPSGERMRAEAEAKESRWDEFLRLTTSTHRGMGAACYGDSGGPNLVGDTIMAINSIGEDLCAGTSYSYRLDTPEAHEFLGQYVTTPGGGDDDNDD